VSLKEEDVKFFCEYVNQSRVLITDTSSASRVRLANTLSELGIQSSKITLADSFEAGEEAMRTLKPRLVICDYTLGGKSGLDLLQAQRSEFKENEDACVFILVTGNSSQTAVARAAEEDVDSFILKPYTLETLRAGLVNAVIAKIRPSQYLLTIREGKKILFSGDATAALKKFEEAIQLDSSPTLAYYYRAQCQGLLNVLEKAETSYEEGLNLNKIHYKCLIGLFDLLSEQKRHDQAYGVVKKIAQYFPANPKRLASVLRLAIITENYDDMEGYYRTFTTIDGRTDELVRYMCSALIVCGKHYLIRKHRAKAVEVFEKAAVTCAGQIQFLKFIIETLVEFQLTDQAMAFFTRYRSADPASDMTKTLEYIVTAEKGTLSQSLEKGRALLKSGVKHPLVYRALIKTCVDSGLEDTGVDLAQYAVKTWPDKASEFLNLVGSDAGLDVPAKNTA
jgi:two-component system chemotaxis response regulator CheY